MAYGSWVEVFAEGVNYGNRKQKMSKFENEEERFMGIVDELEYSDCISLFRHLTTPITLPGNHKYRL